MTRREWILGALAAPLAAGRLEDAVSLLEKAAAAGAVTSASLYVGGSSTLFQGFGRPGRPDTVYLLASITKPMTATGIMVLADRKELSLADPVKKYIPEFRGGDRDLITVRHLLTHTSGLPDMLPENEALRKRHAPLKDFVAGTCKTPLLFKPGSEVRYQSMGILLLAEIAERIARAPFRAFLEKELFRPLGLKETALGLGHHKIPDTAQCQVTGNDDWNWNSLYWRNLGAPWGGAHSTAIEIARFLRMFVEPDGRILRTETARAMVANRNKGMNKPWGLGWAVDLTGFGKGCSPGAFGHSGSTGTICWADPARKLTFVLLTTKPAAESRKALLNPVSDLVSQSA